ncbi:MAG: prepilin-type N-terminal cleavage/methylation domain-containing protein [Rubripirellula sp.]
MKRNAFTLVELMIVIVVIGLLAGMASLAISGVANTAKISRTRGIVSLINDVLLTKYESYKTRPLPVAVANFNAATELKIEVPPREAARIRLLMIRDLMRMEMPDRKIDVLDDPMSISGSVFQVIVDTNNQIIRQTTPVKRPVAWFDNPGNSGKNIPAQLQSYRDRVPQPVPTPSNPTPTRYDGWTREWESAEALYLIMSTTFVDGMLAIEGIPSSNIGDIDGDGMPEILDAWDTPIGFIRWPVDYVDHIDLPVTDDEMDPFRVDFGFVASNAPPVATGATRQFPISLRPLIVSAGSDRVFDLRFGYEPDEVQTGWDDIRFSRTTWPQNMMGADAAGH